MNMLDMYSREKSNKIHLDEMHREARDRHTLRHANQARNLESWSSRLRARLAVVFAALIIMFGALLVALIVAFL